MAAAQVSYDSPSPSRFSSSRPSSVSSRLYDLPAEFSVAQLEARTILVYLLDDLKNPDSRHYERYGEWVERHPKLEELCFRCVRPHVWIFLQGRWSLDALKAVGGDLKSEGRSIYMNAVLGLDRRVRMYIGQTTSLRHRVGQHLNFRHRRDNPSLHYHALQNSIYNAFGTLATLPPFGSNQPGLDSPALLLNVLEMWMCLVFRTLPQPTLNYWLEGLEGVKQGRKEGKEGEFGGLNIASPLDQGAADREWVDCSESDDPIVLEYLGHGSKAAQAVQNQGGEVQDTPAQRREKYKKVTER
ncbi:hypothetical protein IQ07DRAFT_611439 [Pyrenochaeta sp. DS3sAY3a]|nr:hypothetical protein IQ07DRAFT_611439 [Pyrenochaeta sp. DS3sAY3a]